jgi:hypothetical protein
MLRDLWRLFLSRLALGASPAMLRWVAWLSGDAKGTPAMLPRMLNADLSDDAVLAPGVANIPTITAYFVGVTIGIPGDRLALWSLTEYVYTLQTAEKWRRRLAAKYPNCAVLGVVQTFDPTQPGDARTLATIRRKMTAEALQNT